MRLSLWTLPIDTLIQNAPNTCCEPILFKKLKWRAQSSPGFVFHALFVSSYLDCKFCFVLVLGRRISYGKSKRDAVHVVPNRMRCGLPTYGKMGRSAKEMSRSRTGKFFLSRHRWACLIKLTWCRFNSISCWRAAFRWNYRGPVRFSYVLYAQNDFASICWSTTPRRRAAFAPFLF